MDSGALGDLHHAKLLYGNGTARDVRNSAWRDQGMGVLSDLGSHLLDLACMLFADTPGDLKAISVRRNENRAPDHAFFWGQCKKTALYFETSLLSWKNEFGIELVGEQGSAHVQGLCKWGKSTLSVKHRVFPSGRPKEELSEVEAKDPTWSAEYEHFKMLCKNPKAHKSTDAWIQKSLNDVWRTAP